MYIGPFEVLERIGMVAYWLALPPSLSSVHAVFHVSMIRKNTVNWTYVVDGASLLTMQMEPLRRDLCVSWISGNRFFEARL